MYAVGIPLGIWIDAKGPKPLLILSVVALTAGYFPLYQAYERGSGSFTLLCIFSFLTGLGSCAAFNSSVKASALNWPHHRGKATGFPLAAFGLSAFFFSSLGHLLVPGSTSSFLMLLALGTPGIVAVGALFLKVLPHPHYSALPARRASLSENTRLHKTKTEEHKYRLERNQVEPGMSDSNITIPNESDLSDQVEEEELTEGIPEASTNEASYLVSKSPSSGPSLDEDSVKDRAHRVDIRGLKMLPLIEFWQLWLQLGLLSGIGLMTIK